MSQTDRPAGRTAPEAPPAAFASAALVEVSVDVGGKLTVG